MKHLVTRMAVFAAVTLFHCHAFGQSMDTGTVNRTTPANYFNIASGDKFEITFRQASLRDALQFLSWIGDINIMIPEVLDGAVNSSFKDVSIADALNAIIKINTLEYTLEGNVIRIGKSDQFKESGEDLKTETVRLHYAIAKDMAAKIKVLLSGRGSVVDDERTNSLILREIPSNIENVKRFVSDVDIKDAQVLIESKILEATRSFSRDLGIQWGITKGSNTSKGSVAGVTAVGQADSGRNLNVNLPTTATPTSGLMIGSFFKGANLDIQISAAEQRGDIYVISDPSIVTSNGKMANIRSGTKFYVQNSSTVNIGTTTGGSTSAGGGLQEIQTGVELRVIPQITIENYVKLDIEAITSTPDFSRAVQGIPVILDNTAKTMVLVKDGETTVIGGLSRYSDALSRKSVPYLSKIPLLGNLFKSKNKTKDNSELMVFIKPTIVRVEGEAPAQMRIREVEERRQEMYLTPVINPEEDAKKQAAKEKLAKSRRGNKYMR